MRSIKSLLLENEKKGSMPPRRSRILQELSLKVPSTNNTPKDAAQTLYWIVQDDARQLSKRFSFSHTDQLTRFIQEVLEHHEETLHEGRIRIENQDAVIEVNTPGVEDVTNLDWEYAHALDEMYNDIVSISRS